MSPQPTRPASPRLVPACAAALLCSLVPGAARAGDCNQNGWPDEDDLSQKTARDCDANGRPDFCDTAPRSLSLPAQAAAGPSPVDVVVADFDGDGTPEAVAASSSAPEARLFQAGADGTLTTAGPFAIPGFARALVAADVNADGKLDLVVAGWSGVAVLAGKGDGTFVAPATLAGSDSGYFECLAVADLDRDGRLDVAAAVTASATVTSPQMELFFNRASGWTAGTPFPLGDSPSACRAVDLDGDGDLDLATLTFPLEGAVVQVDRNDGAGTFGGTETFPAGANPRGLAVGDLNGDGKPDVAVANGLMSTPEVQATASVFLNDGSGGLAAPRTFAVGSTPADVAAADFDGDGDLDLAVANSVDDSVTLALNDGAAHFAGIAFPSGIRPMALEAGDLDADGTPEVLALTNPSPSPDGSLVLHDVAGPAVADADLDRVPDLCQVPAVTSIAPVRGGRGGLVTARIRGPKLAAGTKVQLERAGESPVVASPVATRPDGSLLATLDLASAKTGAWNVVVDRAGTREVLAGAFEVEAAAAPRVWVELQGRGSVRVGKEEAYVLQVGNAGNVDAEAVIAYVGLPLSAKYALDFTVRSDLTPTDPAWGAVPLHVDLDSERRVPVILPLVPAGGQVDLRLRVSFETEGKHTVHAGLLGGLVREGPGTGGGGGRGGGLSEECAETVLDQALDKALGELVDQVVGTGCVSNAVQFGLGMGKDAAEAIRQGERGSDEPVSWTATTVSMVDTALSCAGMVPGLKPITVGLKAAMIVMDVVEAWDACGGSAASLFQAMRGVLGKLVEALMAMDPNELVGPSGHGEQRYLGPDEALAYAVFFENKPSASAAAREVEVRVPLDPAVFDLASLRWGAVAVGKRTWSPAEGATEPSTLIDLRPETPWAVRVSASVEADVLTWKLETLDPATGLPPEDPVAGFLPPNANDGRGEGSVLFTLRERAGLAHGTPLKAKATILFDGSPLETAEWDNLVDRVAPAAKIDSATLSNGKCSVLWSGTDDGSGIEAWSVFVKEGEQAEKLWIGRTSERSGIFERTSTASTLSFRVQAFDLVGNVGTPSEARQAAEAEAAATPGGCGCASAPAPVPFAALGVLALLRMRRGRLERRSRRQ